MTTTIQLPGGPIVVHGGNGHWLSDSPGVAECLNLLSQPYEAQTYLPDPFERRLDAVMAETGARLIRRGDGSDGRFIGNASDFKLLQNPQDIEIARQVRQDYAQERDQQSDPGLIH